MLFILLNIIKKEKFCSKCRLKYEIYISNKILISEYYLYSLKKPLLQSEYE